MQRLFLDEISGNEVILDAEQSRHIAKSLRMRVGDMLMLCDGEGNDYGSIIEEITKESVRLKICYKQASEQEPDCRVTIYQGVTLGGTGKHTGKRHPTIGNGVLIGTGAKILGPFRVGDNAKIAANAVVLSEVESNSTCVGVPGRIVRRGNEKVNTIDWVHMPDPVAQEICKLHMQIDRLEKKLKEKDNETL